jgi:hypothetical protein
VPFINNITIELSKSDYVPVIKDSAISYGGNQMWFSKDNWYSKDSILHNYGCGTIATADMFLYLALHNHRFRNPETEIALAGTNKIEYKNYDAYVRSINDRYTNTKRVIAVLGPKLANAINTYCDVHSYNFRAYWKLKLSYYDMYDMIEEMLRRDIPVILSIGPNTPNLWGKKGIPFYERCEIDYVETDSQKMDGMKPYYYKAVKQNVNGHYIMVTGIIKDDVTGQIMLRISSWGKQYYINYEEYRDYIENASGTFTSSLVYVKPTSVL